MLSTDHADALCELLDDPALFVDGSATAGAAARSVKSNLQGARDRPEIEGALDKVKAALEAHPVFRLAALPATYGRMMVSRYEPGMGYGLHYDEPFIGGVRTDISFTLFLSAPDSYAGGALVIHSPTGEQSIKLSAGALVLYPADQVHAVEPVTSGSRLVVVGWLRSRVRDPARRALLFELADVTRRIRSDAGAAEVRELTNIRNKLLRMWDNT
ncbi:MAG: Fe2+-dependent dioxygenase [Pseudomonadota bacterium]